MGQFLIGGPMPDVIKARLEGGSVPVSFNENDFVANTPAKVDVIATVTGPPGPQGVGVREAALTSDGILSFTLTDNTSVIAGTVPLGPQGPQGPAGPPGSSSLAVGEGGDSLWTLVDGSAKHVGPIAVSNWTVSPGAESDKCLTISHSQDEG